MGFLRFLESVRNPFLDAVMSAVTFLGDEVFFTAAALFVFWCVSKRRGYFIFAVGLIGGGLSQIMKLYFRVPRPWVTDPGLTIVESARNGAGGYSFPSGHAQSAVGTLGSAAVSSGRKAVKAACWTVCALVCFSRMYLGVHTPLDVAAGALLSALLLACLLPSFRDEETFRRRLPRLFLLFFAVAAAFICFVYLYPFPSDTDPENLAHGTGNAWTLLGCLSGLSVSYLVDKKRDFSVEAPPAGQFLKLALGLGILAALRAALKAVLFAVFGGAYFTSAIRYFIMVLFAGAVWPLTFPLFARIGAKTDVT